MTDYPHYAEEALIVLDAQEGDGNAFRSLVERYDRRLMYFIRRILGDVEDAPDVLQNVWLAVHRNLKNLRSPRAFRVWIYRIAHDQAVGALRKHGPLTFDEQAMDDLAAETRSEDIFAAVELVHAALPSLSVDHRRVLTLRFLEDMSIEDIADVVGCNTGTIKSRLHYARVALRRRIEEISHG